ncbi:acyl-CoA dehydrogenase family protein [Evansella cellulosilytica]|uniref:Acyl-CoA dehydrogenase type 2 domain n=1 Tax=Evansella cellulosilytica (strain ATCC 21833 / DSM 2522 / FERM P-1141 / JCM 9156 / N-4) TaxID=649639 RepID=E6U052_EVAC2|nr:acyl-CoA dehydrogenase family protein [Evansella cellulosilytica]ADU29056.1 Acyl-CoA dehydrogenase type 2 domain [Evansella cellulosilytica DSM 2522]
MTQDNILLKTNKQKELWMKASSLISPFQKRASKHDKAASFPFENFDDLKESTLTTLTVPKEFGGVEASLYEFLLVQETIARGDGATALSLGWHNGTIMNLYQSQKWEPDVFGKVCESIVKEKTIINTAASERATGSPARGGKPETNALKKDDGWIINGRKTFTSLAPMLDWIIITATIDHEGKEQVGEFLLNRHEVNITYEETWDALGMRGTRSDDLILKDTFVKGSSLVHVIDSSSSSKNAQGWLLHIPACYLGIALAARDDAINFAKTYQPNSLPRPIAEVPEVQRKIAEMDLKLMKARHFMYHIATIWDENEEMRQQLGAELAAVKTVCTNAAIEVVDIALRIVGGQSLQKSKPFERYYRDVRAGLHNPPSDDITSMILAKRALQETIK